MPNEQRDQKSKEVTGGFLQLCLYLFMTFPYFSGVPCTTGDRHPRSSPNPCQHQPRGELSDPRGGRHNQHGENIRSLFLFSSVNRLLPSRSTLDSQRTREATRTRWSRGETTRCTRGPGILSLLLDPSQGEQIVFSIVCK